jgi:hypothetical protein
MVDETYDQLLVQMTAHLITGLPQLHSFDAAVIANTKMLGLKLLMFIPA